MKNIREVITAMSSGDSLGAVHINKKERTPMSDERFNLVIKSITRIAISVAGVTLAINIDGRKLLTLVGAGVAFSLIYFGMRD